MWGVFGIVAAGVVIAMLEVPELKRRGFRREMLVFFILLILGVGTACAKVLNVPIPNPDDWVAALLQPLSNIFKTFMQ